MASSYSLLLMAPVKNKRKRGYTRISSKHQVTIPTRALDRVGLKAGDEPKVDDDQAGTIVLTAAARVADRTPADPAAWRLDRARNRRRARVRHSGDRRPALAAL